MYCPRGDHVESILSQNTTLGYKGIHLLSRLAQILIIDSNGVHYLLRLVVINCNCQFSQSLHFILKCPYQVNKVSYRLFVCQGYRFSLFLRFCIGFQNCSNSGILLYFHIILYCAIIGSHAVHFVSRLSQFTIIGSHVVQFGIQFVMNFNNRIDNLEKQVTVVVDFLTRSSWIINWSYNV